MIANHPDTVSEVKLSTGPAVAGAVVTEEIVLGIDVSSARHVVARFVLGEGVKPGESMTTATLLARVAKWRKAQARVTASTGRADGLRPRAPTARTGRDTCPVIGKRGRETLATQTGPSKNGAPGGHFRHPLGEIRLDHLGSPAA